MERHPIDLSRLKRHGLTSRSSKVCIEQAALPHRKGNTLSSFVDQLPDFLAARDLKASVSAVCEARSAGRPIILGMGAHPIKVGLAPIIIDLLERGAISALATNGAAIIHDFEIAFIGRTSEDVAAELTSGSFGMALETGQKVNSAINEGVRKGHGIGYSIGEFIESSGLPFRERSIFAAAHRLGIPATVHVALGTDIVHMHPEADGAMIGEGSLRDFKILTSIIAGLEGGVYLNLGSAVILPEVFLKALTVARNLGHRVDAFTTVNLDFIQHYRPRENVLRRPTMAGGCAYALTGHHEIMFPLLAAMIVEGLPGG